jgi:hypothetical protein
MVYARCAGPILCLLFLGSGCTKSDVLRSSGTTLDVIRTTVDAMWELAVEASAREQRAYVAAVDPETVPFDVAQARLAEIRAAWEPRFAAFGAVRAAHEVAVVAYHAYAAGDADLSTLLEAFEHVRSLYQNLRTLSDADPESLVPDPSVLAPSEEPEP